MKRILLERYIGRTILSAMGLVTLMLAGLQVFMLLVNQLGDIGRVDYGLAAASLFVLLQLPYQIYLFFPMASLLGCLIGLGVLANHSELVVMRASGLSIFQITLAVLKASAGIILLVTLLGEALVPGLSRYANNYKVSALSGGQSLRTSQGMWLRYDNDYVLIGAILPHAVLQGIYQFHFSKQHDLLFARYIELATYEKGAWTAHHVRQTDFTENKTHSSQLLSLPWEVPIKSNIVQISNAGPDEMTLHQLNQFIREQKRSHQNAHSYQLAFYQRLVQPLTTVVMMLLAIPFIFGPLRQSTMGSKLLVGATVGFGFHILNRFLGPFSLVFQWPPLLAALGPTLLFSLLGLYLMRRVR